MTLEMIQTYLSQWGGLALFIIVFLEYLNLPGFPAGIIMPAAGIFASQGGMSFFAAILLSVIAGLLGSWMLYCVGLFGGKPFLDWWKKKFPKQAPAIDGIIEKLHVVGCWGVFVAKLIPAVRTLISIPAGMMKLNFFAYTLLSVMGIAIWNAVFIGAGYFLGDMVFKYLA